jgi:hypothetical protein
MATLKELVTAADVTALTVAQLNVDAHKLNVCASLVRRRYLRPLLGQALHDELLAFAQQAIPDTDDPLAELAEQVKPMLAAWVLVNAWPGLVAQITNAGIQYMQGGAGRTRTDNEDAADLRESYRDTAQFETQELRAWLNARQATYPSYLQPSPVGRSTMPVGGSDFD